MTQIQTLLPRHTVAHSSVIKRCHCHKCRPPCGHICFISLLFALRVSSFCQTAKISLSTEAVPDPDHTLGVLRHSTCTLLQELTAKARNLQHLLDLSTLHVNMRRMTLVLGTTTQKQQQVPAHMQASWCHLQSGITRITALG